MDYDVSIDTLCERFQIRGNGKTEEVWFVDYIASRLEKTEQERRYCSRFLTNFATYDRIRVRLSIYDQSGQGVDALSFVLEDSGYPALSNFVKQTMPGFDGEALRDKHCRLESYGATA